MVFDFILFHLMGYIISHYLNFLNDLTIYYIHITKSVKFNAVHKIILYISFSAKEGLCTGEEADI
jgi:hypothetical protein